ncbi:MAG: transporter substrate-binding domain-containing protein [Verrucomicrobiia bacterium]
MKVFSAFPVARCGAAGLWIAVVGWSVGPDIGRGAGPSEIRGGWSPGVPYQFEVVGRHGEPRLTGLDVEIAKAVIRGAGLRPVFQEMTWDDNLRAVQEGTVDFAMAATPVAERQAWAWFSLPYRSESLVLFVRRGESRHLPRNGSFRALERLLGEGKRLGVVRGYYQGPEVTALLARPVFAGQVVSVEDEGRLLEVLMTGEVEAILADRLAVASKAWSTDKLGEIEMVPGILYETPLCLMFSKASTAEATVLAINQAIEQMGDSGQLATLTRHYLVPQLLLITMKTLWFTGFEVAGTIAFALSGVLIARRERYDIIGAGVLAALPAVGGGIIRDMITNREPIGIVRNPELLMIVLGTVAVGTLYFWAYDLLRRKGAVESGMEGRFRWGSSRGALVIFEAIGLSTFTIIGVMVAIEQRCEPLWLWGPVLGAITASGGGILRDVLRSQSDIPTLKGSIYPEIALVWGLVYSVAILERGAELSLTDIVTLTTGVMVAMFVTRVLVVHFGLRSLFLGRVRKAG